MGKKRKQSSNQKSVSDFRKMLVKLLNFSQAGLGFQHNILCHKHKNNVYRILLQHVAMILVKYKINSLSLKTQKNLGTTTLMSLSSETAL